MHGFKKSFICGSALQMPNSLVEEGSWASGLLTLTKLIFMKSENIIQMRSVLFVLGIVLAVGCGGQNTKNQISESVDKQSELLVGSWMSDMYLQKIEETRSVYANKDSEPKILGLLFKEENLKSDNALLYGFTSHEGGIEIPIHLNPSGDKFLYDEERANKSSNFNNPFELNLIGNNKLEVKFFQNQRTEIYRKVKDEQTELRRLLFEGDFKSIDDGKKFSFNRTGTLAGFDEKMTFEVIYDFGLNIEFDAIVMYKKIEAGNWSDGEVYKYEFNSDTLKLYHVNANWETLNYEIGELRYELKMVKE